MAKSYHDVETSFDDYFVMPNQPLRSALGRIKRGSDNEYRTEFYPNLTLEEILGRWMRTLRRIKSEWPSLYEFEIDLSKKVGPMSIMKPLSERMDDIDSYYTSILPEGEPISKNAVDAVIREWGRARGLRLRGQDHTLLEMKKSTNSGSPYYRKKRDVMWETVPCEVYLCRDQKTGYPTVVQELPTGTWKAAAVLGWRGQEGGPSTDDVKQRVVWMFPFAVNVAELQLYQPLIAAAQRHKIVPAWVNHEEVDRRITNLFDSKRPSDLIVCTDFTKFDQHFGKPMQQAAHDILAALMDRSSSSTEWLENVFPIKYNIPLVFEEDYIRMGPHGMGSGAGGTNGDETLAHRALQFEAAQTRHKILNPNSQCLGDDGILSYPGITVEDVTASYTRHGLNMNLEKQYASQNDCTYLRRWHHKNYREGGVCVGVYSTCRAIGRLAEQERYYDPEIWDEHMVALRQLSILENIKYHPLRTEFVRFCMKGDKYRLGIDIPGFLDRIADYAKEATDYMPDFLGYVRSQMSDDKTRGIENWWIVQYLKSLA